MGQIQKEDFALAPMAVNVKRCQRCGKDHEALGFIPLSNPADRWTRWAICPNNAQPVMLACIAESVPGPLDEAVTFTRGQMLEVFNAWYESDTEHAEQATGFLFDSLKAL